MHLGLLVFFTIAVVLRVLSLAVSIRNERALRQAGAQEFGAGNSAALAVIHVLYYGGALLEAHLRHTQIDTLSYCAIGLYGLAMVMLAIVIRELGPLWTVKLYLASGHTLNRSWLFRHVRHPNYFLNVIPELVAYAVVFHAWIVMLTILPAYLYCLVTRIIQEERLLRERLPGYA